jgi:hypothetical protein
MLRITMRSVIISGRTTSCCFLVTRKRDGAGLCNVTKGWAGCCIIIIKKPRNLAEKSRMILEVDCTCARTTILQANAQVSSNIACASTGKATKGWATINALQFLESEPWINIFDHTDVVFAQSSQCLFM